MGTDRDSCDDCYLALLYRNISLLQTSKVRRPNFQRQICLNVCWIKDKESDGDDVHNSFLPSKIIPSMHASSPL